MIANYRVKKIRQKNSVIKTNFFDWELLTLDDIKTIVHFGFSINFCLENKSVYKGGFVFVMITEIF